MDLKVTCFDRAMYLVRELPENKLQEAVEMIQEYSFSEFLEFCVENGCFNKEQSQTLFDGIVMWEDLEGNYCDEDKKKLNLLYERVGVTGEVFEMYAN